MALMPIAKNDPATLNRMIQQLNRELAALQRENQRIVEHTSRTLADMHKTTLTREKILQDQIAAVRALIP